MSSARSRQQKRKSRDTRPVGVWRQSQATPSKDGEPAAVERVEHGVRNEISISWRMFSGLIVAALALVLVAFFMTDIFYVRAISLEGARYLNESEVFAYADIAESHVFWVDPDTVRQNLLDASPIIADAEVRISWPPDMVTIIIEEREPALLWTQGGVRVLLDVRGNVLRSPRDDESFPDLLHVIADNSFNEPRLPSDPVSLDVVAGALQMQNIVAGLPSLQYNRKYGLGFRETNGQWDVWLGTGTDMVNKLRVYEKLRDDLLTRGITPAVINVADLDAVYYCGSTEFCYE